MGDHYELLFISPIERCFFQWTKRMRGILGLLRTAVLITTKLKSFVDLPLLRL